MAEVLDISVPASLARRWREWFCPELQPFRTDLLRSEVGSALPDRHFDPPMEWVDTFFMYGGRWTWLAEAEFWALRPSYRRALLAVRRKTVHPKLLPVWPSELEAAGDELMFDWVASGQVRPSRHQAVPGRVWADARSCVPRAQLLAGSFATTGSGPNCFGTVLAAACEDDTFDEIQVGPDDFRAWLEERTQAVVGTGHDDEPGVVFAWTEHGRLAHATITIGSGWMLTKPSQAWSSPRLVYTVRDAVNAWRLAHTRLTRHRLLR